MGLFDKMMGYGSVDSSNAVLKTISPYIIEGEDIIKVFTFFRDSIVISTEGLYLVDVQGITGKKVEVKFFPAKGVKYVSFESASTFDYDVDIKIGVDGNSTTNGSGMQVSVPIAFKVPKAQHNEAQEVVKLIKYYHICNRKGTQRV